MFNYEKFSDCIKIHRQKLGYTQEIFAEKIGIGYKHLNNIERGLAKPSVLTVIKILNILNLNLNACLNNTTTEKELKIKEILSCIDLMKPDKYEKMYLLSMINIISKRINYDGNK